jgi:DNA mismatch repair protein MutS2
MALAAADALRWCRLSPALAVAEPARARRAPRWRDTAAAAAAGPPPPAAAEAPATVGEPAPAAPPPPPPPPSLPPPGEAERESLEMLEWRAVCRQVARFARTPAAAARAAAGLTGGATRAASEALLRETREAGAAELDFSGAYDVGRAVAEAAAGRALHPAALGAVASTLRAAARLRAAVAARGPAAAALAALAAPIGDAAPALRAAIEAAVAEPEGRLRDEASPALAAARAARRANGEALRRAAAEAARALHAAGAAERPQVAVRRGRLCVPVRAGRAGDAPRGSVRLGASASGGTVFLEPAPLVPLNNAEAVGAAAEAAEEARVSAELTAAVAVAAAAVRGALAGVAALDLAAARAAHARWLSAREPTLTDAAAAPGVDLRGARHPLLLAPALPPLPSGPPAGGGAAPAFGPMAELAIVPGLFEAVAGARAPAPAPRRGAPSAPASAPPLDAAAAAPAAVRGPVPVDLLVPPGARVALLTGPNTGGKTAALKLLGVCALMARAGLFVPAAGGAAPGAPPALPWFRAVLADVGDAQSLAAALSTFSGGVRRARAALAAADRDALVLLDEAGAGTDPAEGAALAGALLRALAARAGLAAATTHASELRALGAAAPGWCVAAAEFDAATLRPTFALRWGEAGASSALDVAEGLGFDAAVVAEARCALAAAGGAGAAGAAARGRRAAALARALAGEVAAARGAAGAAAARRAGAEAELAAARREAGEAEAEAARAAGEAGGAAAAAAEERARAAARAVVGDLRAGRLTPGEAEAALRRLEADARGDAEPAAELGARLQAAWGRGGGSGAGGGAGPAADAGAGLDAARSAKSRLRAAPALRAGRAASAASGASELAADAAAPPRAGVAVQTSANTLDVRGLSGDEAATALESAAFGSRRGDVIFVVHGVGTGRVRAAVLAAARRSARVARAEEAENSQGGCTVVYLK